MGADEALRLGLATRVVPSGTARDAAVALGHELAALPQVCLRNDRASLYAQWDLDLPDALRRETELGIDTLRRARRARTAPPASPAAPAATAPPPPERFGAATASYADRGAKRLSAGR